MQEMAHAGNDAGGAVAGTARECFPTQQLKLSR
jgi:hypothetical protein